MKRKKQKGIELKSDIRVLTTPFKVILRHILCSLVWVADVRGEGGGGEGRRFPAHEKREVRPKGAKGTPPNFPFARVLACPNSLSLRTIATQSIVLLRIFLFTHIMAWRSTVRAVAVENKQTNKGKNITYRLRSNWIFSWWTGYSLVGICAWTSLPGRTRSTNCLTTNWVGTLETKKRTMI